MAFLLTLILVFTQACQKSIDESLIARVNDDTINADEFRLRLEEYRMGATPQMGPTPEEVTLKRKVLNEMIEERLLLGEARKLKLEVTSDQVEDVLQRVTRDYPETSFEERLKQQHISKARFKDRIRSNLLIEKLVSTVAKDVPAPSQEQIEKFYKDHIEDFHTEDQIHLQQIVVKTEEDAQRILDELKEGTSFGELAKKHSFTSDAAQGGDLGFISPSSMPKEIADEISKLSIGRPSRAISSDYGIHILKIVERRGARVIPLEEASASIVKTLTERDREGRFSAWRKEILSKAKIERNHALLASIP